MVHIIDDEVLIRDLIQCFASEVDADTACFESGDKYLEYLNSPKFEKPVVVLSDVTMPGINGYDLALEIRKKYPFQKMILITGNSDDQHHIRAARQLCYTLDKPFQPEKLILLIKSLIACDKAYGNDSKRKHLQSCEFGLDHDCPFHTRQA